MPAMYVVLAAGMACVAWQVDHFGHAQNRAVGML